MTNFTQSNVNHFHIVPMPGTFDRYMSVGKKGKKLTDCFGHGFKTRHSAFLGTIIFIKKHTAWKKNQNKKK